MNSMFLEIWPYIWGSGVILIGCFFVWKREIGIGIRGKAPLFYIDGVFAVILGLLTILIGIYFLVNPGLLK